MSPVTLPSNIINQKNGVQYTISTIPFTKYNQVYFTKEFTLNNGDTKITSVNLSLQSVDEVMEFFIGFFPYLIGAALLLSFLMVTVYSKTFIKPIVHITKISNRMADMEFGIELDLQRNDELGALSSSLNTLSANLKNALGELSTANEQLKNDYEQELRQEHARKEFVANVSHELKTPLGIIKSYSEGLQDGVKDEKRDYYIEVILDEVTRMDQMLCEMLEISKFDAGVVVFHKDSTDIKPIINKSIDAFMNKASERELNIDVQGDYNLVSIDADKIERVLNNFIGNAVKYSKSHSTIRIEGECNNRKQTILIRNECEPFSDDVLSKLWNRFYKADTSHNRETEGTGLGLSIAKSILEGHGCNFGVKNTDIGVCFYFEMERA
jgi:signal transduction histidine kinase